MPAPVASLADLVVASPEVIGSALSIDTTVLPFTIQADTLSLPWSSGAEHFTGDQIIDSNGNVQTATNHGFTNAATASFTLASVANASLGTTIYTGVITGGANNAYIGITFKITGFTDQANNGLFTCFASSATSLTLSNANGAAEAAAATARGQASPPAWSTTPGGLTTDGTVIWVYLGFPATTRVEILVYNQTFTFRPGVHGFVSSPALESFTTFTGSIAVDPTVPETLLQIRGRNFDPASSAIWVSSTNYAVGDQITDSNGNVQTVLVAGKSGPGSHPVWASSIGQQTADMGVTWIETGIPAVTQTDKINLIFFQTNDAIVIAPPSGIKAYKGENSCQLEWVRPTFPGTLGVRVMLSTDPTGVSVPFKQFGDVVFNETRSANAIIGSETTTNVNGNTTIITTTETTLPINYSSVTILPPDVQNSNIFYAMLSTVIQDPATNHVFESQQNGPIACGFVNLHVVSPTDFLALQRKEDIAGRLITQITKLYPDLDLTPRSELRDLVIDPFSLELANMSVREWFSRVSTSISAISQLDDNDGDGFSDPFDASPLKQQLARAYGLSASDTQTLVDKQFDILAEQAGVTRGGVAASVVELTFFSFIRPTVAVTFPIGIQCGTVADANTPALTFVTRASATIDPLSADSFYNPQFGWWAVTVPAECTTAGSVGNVGAGTIRSVASGAPNGWNVTNLDGADFGQDTQINSKLAALIQVSLVAGRDSGTRSGYQKAAIQTPGVVQARVVAAGDLEMVRDWDPLRKKHVFGAVDVYTRGTSFSEQDSDAVFSYQNTGIYGSLPSYLAITLLDRNLLKFNITNFNSLAFDIYTGLEFVVNQGSSDFFLGTAKAQFDNNAGTFVIDPNESAYRYVGTPVGKTRIPLLLNNVPATNRQAIAALLSAQLGNFTFALIARMQSPLQISPTFQPVLKALSVVGQGDTGVVESTLIRLIHTSDFLLNGGSNKAGDEIAVNSTSSLPTSISLTMNTNSETIDTAMDITTNVNGVPGDVLSVRSADLSRLFAFGTDYNLLPANRYRTYALNLLGKTFNLTSIGVDGSGVLTVVCPNNFVPGASVTFSAITGTGSFLNGQTVIVATATPTGFTALFAHAPYGPTAQPGLATGQNVAPGATVVVSYNKFVVYERLTKYTGEAVILNGTIPTPLAHEGFVRNTWLPESYQPVVFPPDSTSLSYDGAVFNPDGSINIAASTGLVGAQISHDSRYIKVTFDGNVMVEGIDYALAVNSVSGAATLARILTGHIGDAGTVLVTYYTNESFTIATQYPAFVEQLATTLEITKHAAADVLVKAMVANGVDVTLTVELSSTATPEVMDPRIRTIIGVVMDNATAKLTQAELIRQIKALTGISNVQVPLTKFAKTDGAYDIDVIVPTFTSWLKLAQDPAFATSNIPVNSFITQFPVLPDVTIPSGGLPDAFVGMLYEGEPFVRAASIQEFLAAGVPTFYIIGTNDSVDGVTSLSNSYAQKILLKEVPIVTDPGVRFYRVTYQVFNEGGTKDITISSTEYLVPGRVTINFVTGS